MLKYILYLIVIFIVGGLITGGIHLYRVAQKNKKEMAQYQGDEAIAVKPLGKVLVVYYSLSGHTRDIAEIIRNKTGADIYEIKTAEPIKQNPLMYLKIRKQQENSLCNFTIPCREQPGNLSFSVAKTADFFRVNGLGVCLT